MPLVLHVYSGLRGIFYRENMLLGGGSDLGTESRVLWPAQF